MKKMNVKKEILVIVMIIVAMVTICSNVLATDASNNPIQIPIINTNPTPDTDTNTDANPITPTTNSVTPTTNTTGSDYQNATTLPQTGDASDYAIFMLIVVAGIVAVFAYKKVREYNIK